ncbi:MAG: TPM domain-containing protein [Angelakisella sp.]
MKKLLTRGLALFIVLTLLFTTFAFGQEGEQRVFDDAGLFSADELPVLENKIAELRQSLATDLVVVTTDNAQGKTATAYADDYYDNNGFGVGDGSSGALFLIDMDNREICISTTGEMIDILTDARIDSILDDAYEVITIPDYYACAMAFLYGVEEYSAAGVPEGQFQKDTNTGEVTIYTPEPQQTTTGIPVGLLLGSAALALLVAALACGGVVMQYRMVGRADNYSLEHNSNLDLTCREDIFLHQTVTQQHIERSSGSSGGGGSSTHRSSSGVSHGGGSRKF